MAKSKIVKNMYGDELDFYTVPDYMDDDIRERLHSQMAPCSDQDFFDAYCKTHREQFSEEFFLNRKNPTW